MNRNIFTTAKVSKSLIHAQNILGIFNVFVPAIFLFTFSKTKKVRRENICIVLAKLCVGKKKKGLAPVNKVLRNGLTQGPYVETFPEMDRLTVHIWTFYKKYM